MFIPTIFLPLVFHLQEHTNPTNSMGAKQKVLTLFLVFFLNLAFFITFVPLNKRKIISMLTLNF